MAKNVTLTLTADVAIGAITDVVVNVPDDITKAELDSLCEEIAADLTFVSGEQDEFTWDELENFQVVSIAETGEDSGLVIQRGPDGSLIIVTNEDEEDEELLAELRQL